MFKQKQSYTIIGDSVTTRKGASLTPFPIFIIGGVTKGCDDEMRKDLDLIGEKFGKLKVVRRAITENKSHSYWVCRCDCGKEVVVRGSHLKSGCTKSCGCLIKETCIMNGFKHGQCKSRLYHIWDSMKQRCSNPKSGKYSSYGCRGIKVCDDWQKFEPFRDWALANGYSDELTIDRIDVDGNYEPSNCRWASSIEQANNRRNNYYVKFGSETHSVAEWSRKTNISALTIISRIKLLGWSVEKALTTPTRKNCNKKRWLSL